MMNVPSASSTFGAMPCPPLNGSKRTASPARQQQIAQLFGLRERKQWVVAP